MNFSIFKLIEKDGTGIGSDIEKDGTGIEKDGTGIRASRKTIEKDGTGIRAGSFLSSALMAIAFIAPVSAAEFSGVVNQADGRITVSLSNGSSLLTGTGLSENGYALVSLNGIELPSSVQSEGDGTGISSEGDGTGISSEGDGTGIKSEGDGTGVASEGDGTGVASEGDGTGVASEGDGTGIASEGDGTGIASEGDGTGIASEGDGTGIASEGDGTGFTQVCFQRSAIFSEGDGTGISSEGDGTGISSEGDGTGISSEGDGTGVSSEGDGTGANIESFAHEQRGRSGLELTVPRDFLVNPGADTAYASDCNGSLVNMSIGFAEVALEGNIASVLLYGVRAGGEIFEIAAIEMPIIRR